MGAALTYARRYALFTLVGIAGEDDLDAPDLSIVDPVGAKDRTGVAGKMNGHAAAVAAPSVPAARARSRRETQPSAPILDAEASATLRQKLVSDIAGLDSADTALEWAGRSLGAKNTLTTGDSCVVEASFRDRMQVLDPEVHQPNPAPLQQTPPEVEKPSESMSPSPASLPTSDETPPAAQNARKEKKPSNSRDSGSTGSERVDKSSLTLNEPRRYRDKDHLRFVSSQACVACGRQPCEAHHLRFAQQRALGRKVSDEFTVPVCRSHHRELHRHGDEAAWWQRLNIDPMPIALRLWQHTRGILLSARSGQELEADNSIEGGKRAPHLAP
jgi:hypothetical protein